MFTFQRRIGLSVAAGLLVCAAWAPEAMGQFGTKFSTSNPGFFPFYQVAPGLTLQQAALNIATMGRAYSQFPPWAAGFAPNAALGYGPLFPQGAPGSTQALMNSASANPALTRLWTGGGYANPYLYGGYGGGGYGGGGYPAALTTGGGYPSYGGYEASAYGGYGAYTDPLSGYLRGSAEVVNAQGRFKVSMRQADLLKEQRVRERIDNRKRMFDEYLYEKKHTPTWAQLQAEQHENNVLHWVGPNVPPGEIWSGTALNALMDEADQLQLKGVSGPDIPLDAKVLQNINVGPKGTGGGSGGLIKQLPENGTLRWPLAFRTEPFKTEVQRDVDKINDNLATAVADAKNEHTDASVMAELRDARERLAEKLKENSPDLPMDQYIDARRFLDNLGGAIRLLKESNAGKYLGGDLAATGKTVKDLVKYMKGHGLEFKPAVDGQENEYVSLHHALAAYDIGARQQQMVAEGNRGARKPRPDEDD